jgi:hypothetical protein
MNDATRHENGVGGDGSSRVISLAKWAPDER